MTSIEVRDWSWLCSPVDDSSNRSSNKCNQQSAPALCEELRHLRRLARARFSCQERRIYNLLHPAAGAFGFVNLS